MTPLGSAGPLPRTSFDKMLLAYSGRNTGPEPFLDVTHVNLQQTQVQRNLTIDKPLEAVQLVWRGRIVIGVSNVAAIASEAPVTILDRIQIVGTYKGSSLTPIDMSGATIWALPRCFGFAGSSLIINNVRQPEIGLPYQQLGGVFGNVGTYDVEIYYLIPLAPLIAHANRAGEIAPFCMYSQDWNDSVRIQINFGDGTSFGTPGAGQTTTFTAIGTGAGSPSVRIALRSLLLGPLRNLPFRTSSIVRFEQPIVAGISAINNAVQLMQLTKQKTTGVLLKTGQKLVTGITAGVTVFGTLSDKDLDFTQIILNNRAVRNNQDNRLVKEHAQMQQNTVIPQGYLPMWFVDSQHVRTAYRADLQAGVVGSGATFILQTNILVANANEFVTVTQEQINAEMTDPAWADTR